MYSKQKTKKEPKNISFVLFLYWVVVILWQTFRPVGNRSILDTAVKFGVFLAVVLYAYSNRSRKYYSVFIGAFLLFIATQVTTFYVDHYTTSIATLITFAFMVIQIFVFFGWQNKAEMHTNHLEWFCQRLIQFVLIMCLYNMIFSWNRFSVVFSLSSGNYGYECSSFLYSNHEFALYTAGAIISLTWLVISKKIKPIKSIVLYLIFALNILSTYSRAALLGCIGAILVLMFFYSKKIFAWVFLVAITLLTVIMSNSYLYSLVFEKILKGSFTEGEIDAGRSAMYQMEWGIFNNGTLIEKLFGQGYGGASLLPGHNAYLMILLTGGIVMFAWFMFVICFGIYHAIKVASVNKGQGSLLLGFQILSLMYMIAQTPILFYSTMDSFFITSVAVLMPYYVSNGYFSTHKKRGILHENITA